MGADFVHIHVHSHYSLQDAAATVGELVKAAKEDGMTALALTDHGVMYGIAEFYKKAKEAGIKPIIGSELYIVPDKASRFDKGKNERLECPCLCYERQRPYGFRYFRQPAEGRERVQVL